MARKIKLTPYGEQLVDTFEEDAGSSEFVSYLPTPSIVRTGDLIPDDPIPLFLSSQADEPQEPRFGRAWNEPAISSRTLKSKILKTSILAATAVAIVFAILSVENPRALFANAKASLIGIPAGPPSSGQPAQPAPAIQSNVGVRVLPPTARDAPTRDEIAAALKAAHQSQPEIRQPPAAAAPARRLNADELAALLKRARGLIAIGDIAPARLLLERAADAQEAGAALLLAQTYDPAVLGTQDMRSITPDPAAARAWYQKAAQFGSPDAQQRLAQMQN